ncbi:MAG TPA: hypothetical protein VFV34_26640, partial [Blastocatellia bacterium]|nr:hypothetical protein [Blastocatellia bacterium]
MRKILVSLSAFTLLAGYSAAAHRGITGSGQIDSQVVCIEDQTGIRLESFEANTPREPSASNVTPLDGGYDGCWTGNSSVGPVTFLVSNNAITYVRAERGAAAGCITTGSVTIYTALPLQGNSINIAAGSLIRLSGSFESSTSASGVLSYDFGSGCSGTSQWTASSLNPSYILTIGGTGRSNASATIAEGESASFDIAAMPFNGFSDPAAITINVFGANSTGISPTASISSNPLAQGQTQQLTVGVPSDTPPGSYTVMLQGVAAGTVRTALISLSVVPTQGFAVSLSSSSSKIIYTGGSESVRFVVFVLAAGDFKDSVHLSASVSPEGGGVRTSFAPPDLIGGGISLLTVSIDKDTAGGTYAIAVKGTSGQVIKTAPLTLEVVRDFDLA